jgi:hypothetical protein
LLLTNCSTVKKLEIFKTEVEREHLNLPVPESVELDNLNFIIVTSENAEEVFAKLKEKNIDPAVFALIDTDYETLAKNFAQIRAYIIKQNIIIEQYKNYYESEKE